MDVEQIKRWFDKPRKPTLAKGRVMESYFSLHPRVSFLKSLPTAANIVDIGAGEGSLSAFLDWLAPKRPDLAMYAYALAKGRLFDRFQGYELSDWNLAPPEFDGRMFDAIVCAHFIEHIAEPTSFVDWAARKLTSEGRIYLEWPSPASLDLPPRSELASVGVPLMISRFDDDPTHRELPDCAVMIEAFESSGFLVETRGIVRLPWLEDEMLAHFKDSEVRFPRQAAFWSLTGWSQYLVVRRAQ
jgi:SAM-dependent methyltransferase